MATTAAADEAEGGLATSMHAPENTVSLGPGAGVSFAKRAFAQVDAGNQARDDASATLDAQGVPVQDFEAYESLVAELEALYGAQPSVNYVPPDPRYTNADYQPREDAPDGDDAVVADPAATAYAEDEDGPDVDVEKAAEAQEIGGDLDDEDLDKAVAVLMYKATGDRMAKSDEDDPPEKPDNPDKPSSKKTDADRIIEKLGAPPPPTPEEQAQDQAEAAADGPDDDDDDADDDAGEKSMEDADLQKALADLEDDAYDLAKSLGGPFIGPNGGKWADPEHKIAWQPNDPHGAAAIHAQHPNLSTAKAHAVYKQAGGALPLSTWQHHHIRAKKAAALAAQAASTAQQPAPATAAPIVPQPATTSAALAVGHILTAATAATAAIGTVVESSYGEHFTKIGLDHWEEDTLPGSHYQDDVLSGSEVVYLPASAPAAARQPAPAHPPVGGKIGGKNHLDALPVGSTLDGHVHKTAHGWRESNGDKIADKQLVGRKVVSTSAPAAPPIESVHHELLGKFAAKAKAMQADDIKDSGDTEATGTHGKYTNRAINHLEAAHEHAKAGRHHAAADHLQMAASSAKEAAGAIGEYGGHWKKLADGLQSVSEVHGHGDYTKDPHWSAANHEQVQANAAHKAAIGKSTEQSDVHKSVSAVIGRDVGPGFTLAPHEAAQIRARLAGRPGFADLYKFAADSGFYGKK